MSLISHSWNLSPQDARKLQQKLAPLVSRKCGAPAIKTVAGIDVGIKAGAACAALVTLKIIHSALFKDLEEKLPEGSFYIDPAHFRIRALV
jgi:deoxyinosine 3'endonuclease (endonuclease V)